MAKYDDLIITVGALVLGLELYNYITKSTMFAYASAPAKPKPVAAKPAVIKSKLPKPLTTGQLHQGQVKKVVGEQTDRTNLSFTSGIYTSKYHLYAGGLDWSKSVGLLIYTDGSGEYGLKHPKSSYLLAGNNGMIAVAKKHNMVLLTPLSPNKNCSDGDGSCWYLGDPPGYARWAEALVKQVQSQYPIDKKRIAVGGYCIRRAIFYRMVGAFRRCSADNGRWCNRSNIIWRFAENFGSILYASLQIKRAHELECWKQRFQLHWRWKVTV